MNDSKEDPVKKNAHNSLALVREMKQAGLRRASYPKWFFAVIACLIFSAFINIKPVGMSDFPYFIVALILYKVVQKSLGVVPLKDKKREWKFVGGVFVIAVLFVVVTYFKRELGLDWLPYITGAVVASTYYWIKSRALDVSERAAPSVSNDE